MELRTSRVILRPWQDSDRLPFAEAAEAAVRFGFQQLGLSGLVANTVEQNAASQRVMRRLGMERDPEDDFDHPRLATDDPLRRQVLYRLPREMWLARSKPVQISAMPPA